MANSSGENENRHKSLRLSARIALYLPNLLARFVQDGNESTLALLLSASRAHVASDDAFEVDFRPFLEKFHPLTFSLEKTEILEPPDFPALYNTVITYLRFLEAILLMEHNSATSTEMIADHFKLLPTLLAALIGLKNRQIAELACHVYRLILGKLNFLFPEGSSEVSEAFE